MSAFSEAFDNNSEKFDSGPIPEGSYECTLIDVETESNPMSGEMATTLVYEVDEGQHAKRRVWDKVKHVDSVAWKAAQIYRSYGIEGKPERWEEWANTMSERKGSKVKIEVAHRVYNDKTYTNVVRANLSDKPPF